MNAHDTVAEERAPAHLERRARRWWLVLPIVAACCAAVGLGLSQILSAPLKGPLSYSASPIWNCFTRDTANQHNSYTLGLSDFVNSSAEPVTITSAKPVLAAHMRLAQMYVAPVPPHATYPVEAVGTGFGLPSNDHDNAVGHTKLNRRLWSERQRVPGAVVPPARANPKIEYQVVLGATREGSDQAYLRDFDITYKAGSHTFRLKGFAYLFLPSKAGNPNGGCNPNFSGQPGSGNIGRLGP